VNSVLELEEVVHYPVEFLHTLNSPAIPPHNLCLKFRTPIMLLHNIISPKLCYGARLQVKELHRNVTEATIFIQEKQDLCGTGETVFILRTLLNPSDYHFQFIQFSIKVCVI